MEVYRAGKGINTLIQSGLLQLLSFSYQILIAHIVCRVAYTGLIKDFLIVPKGIGIKILRNGVVLSDTNIVVYQRLREIILNIGLGDSIAKICQYSPIHIAVGMEYI